MENLLEKKLPREGTKLRELYEFFQANKGVPLDWSSTSGLYQLTDFYGLDIVRLSSKRWLFAGEWFGRVYVDYVADPLKRYDRKVDKSEKLCYPRIPFATS